MTTKEHAADVAIVGAGIVGLAHAYMALRKGYKVVLFEREKFAVGASIRNFGLVWPIGQPPGPTLDRALRSRNHWQEVSTQAECWLNTNGSLHLAYQQDEWDVLNEFVDLYKAENGYQVELMTPAAIQAGSSVANIDRLKGGLFSKTECTVNPREAIRKIPLWLEEKYGLTLRFGHAVTAIEMPKIKTSREVWKVDKVFVCSGADCESLYPEIYDAYPVIKSKLQMMKAVSMDDDFKLGPTLCGGLTLLHYNSFSKCPSLPKVNARFSQNGQHELRENGIHVMLAQNNHGELIIGDSHHYSMTVDPFEREDVNEMILRYLESFAHLTSYKVTERWHGIYLKSQAGTELITDPEPDVTIVNCLGGAGMTLSFGLAEEIIARL